MGDLRKIGTTIKLYSLRIRETKRIREIDLYHRFTSMTQKVEKSTFCFFFSLKMLSNFEILLSTRNQWPDDVFLPLFQKVFRRK